jgi:L-ascorbate metabolism protein UlaG (beta-lactamase superfamily)
MNHDKVYLKPNIVIEPLVDQWYAWSHLISPATAAMNILERHLKIMESYVQAPQVHAAAAKNPALLGGPFIDYPTNRVEGVKALMQETIDHRAQSIALAKALRMLDEILSTHADGHSLEPIYPKVPEVLRGYVELVYDHHGYPAFRVIEPLLYHSPFCDPSRQSLRVSAIDQDWRPFVMSTPRLAEPNTVHLRIPLASAAIDALCQMTSVPQAFGSIKERLAVEDKDEAVFASFFTTQPPRQSERYQASGIRWRYFGHACVLVETAQVSILLDPVLSYTYEHDIPRYTYEDLPDEIDYVLITHNHQDHIMLETLLRLRHRVKHIIVPRNGAGALQDPSLRLMLTHLGFRHIIDMDELDSLAVPGGAITALPFLGEHGDLNIRTKMAWLVQLMDRQLVFAADSCNVEPALYEHLHTLIGDVDVLFLGMECDGAPLSWVYGPLLTQRLTRKMDQSRRLSGSNDERGMALVHTLKCREVYVYAMGQEPWLNHVMSLKYTDASKPIVASNALIAACCQRGLHAERLFGHKEVVLT